ncbi:hypothetical protein JYT76_00900 [Olleya sp. AH-315-F22]|nr:hypothetical protein [Olleya sp. AH-315-F22]
MSFKLLLIVIFVFILGCSNNTEKLIGKNYSAKYHRLECFDSIKFVTDSIAYFYFCDVGWEYFCFYITEGDTVVIESNLTQDEDNNYNRYDFNFRMKLLRKEKSLKRLSLEHKNQYKWQLDTSDVFNYFDEFKIIK